MCFSDRSEKQDGRSGIWLAETFSTSLKPLNRVIKTWQEAGSQCPLQRLWFFGGRSEKQNGRQGLWLAETFSTSSLKLLNGIQRNLTGSKISLSSTKFVFFGADRKNKKAALASDYLRHFRLPLWNSESEFNKTWQEAWSQCPLPSLCFRRQGPDPRPLWLVKQDGRPGLWFAETFSTSSLKPLNGIQRNLTGSKIFEVRLCVLSFGFLLLLILCLSDWSENQDDRKQNFILLLLILCLSDWSENPPWPLIGLDIFDFFPETAERNSTTSPKNFSFCNSHFLRVAHSLNQRIRMK